MPVVRKQHLLSEQSTGKLIKLMPYCSTCRALFEDMQILLDHEKTCAGLGKHKAEVSWPTIDLTQEVAAMDPQEPAKSSKVPVWSNQHKMSVQRVRNRKIELMMPYCTNCRTPFEMKALLDHQKTCAGLGKHKAEVSWPTIDLAQEEAVMAPQDWNDAEMVDCSLIQSVVAEPALTGTDPIPIPQNLDLLQKNFSTGEASECAFCHKSFQTKSGLQWHSRIHTDEWPYHCCFCDRRFQKKPSLEEHTIRSHTGQKPYECGVCHLGFKQKSHLDQHQRIHNRDKPYQCSVCPTRFRYKCHLDKHRAMGCRFFSTVKSCVSKSSEK